MTTPLTTDGSLYSKSYGERGLKVRIYEKRLGGPLYYAVWVGGREEKKSLGHRDVKLAETQAYSILANLTADDKLAARGSLSLGALIARYLDSEAHYAKNPRWQHNSAGYLKRAAAFFGDSFDAATFSKEDVLRYTRKRRADGVRNQAIRTELQQLKTACRWAYTERVDGARLLREDPWAGLELPTEKNPQRPEVYHDDYEALLAHATDANTSLLLVVVHETGQRIGAILRLRWEDVQWKPAALLWREESDKMGYEDTVPMTAALEHALTTYHKAHGEPAKGWLFPSTKYGRRRGRLSDEPLTPNSAYSRLVSLYARASIKKPKGGGWHQFRRKWATDRKGYPVVDVMQAGRWRSAGPLLKSYWKADDVTVAKVISTPTGRRFRKTPTDAT